MDTGKMGMLDTQDLTLFLTYQYVKDLKMKQLGNQIYNLGVSAGLDLENVDCDLQLEEVIGVNRNIERKSDCQDSEQHTKKLVYSYLRRNGYDVAEEFATTCNLKQTTVNLSIDLEAIFQSKGMHLIPKTDKTKKRKPQKRNGFIAGVDFIDSDLVKFTNANSKGGSIVMTYKGYQYSFKSFSTNQKVSYWQCRRHGTLKCHGLIHLCKKTTSVIKEIAHNDKDHTERLIASTMGTVDTSIRYSKTRVKTPVLHFQGYEYVKDRVSSDGRVRWKCRYLKQKKCKGYLLTKNGQIDGQVQEHSHLPTDLPPVDKPKSDRMISSLF